MKDILTKASELSKNVVEWRHVFHADPELSFLEEKTSARIASILREIGYEDVTVGIPLFPGTGVIANLNPGKSGPCLALRADIDALPIREMADVPYASKNENVAHSCGHDAHISMMLGVAKVLFDMKDKINGNVRFIFQPGEEAVLPGKTDRTGAAIIVEDSDVMDGVDGIVALHVWGTMPSGQFGYRAGPVMTMNGRGVLYIEGKGGHGAMPHTCVDPVVVAGQILSAWQTIVSREINPLDMCVITVGRISAEGAWNIIPQSVEMIFGTRTLSVETMRYIEKRMEAIAFGVASGMNCTINFKFAAKIPPVITDAEMMAGLVATIESLFGKESLFETPPLMPSEDFSKYQEKAPGVLLFLGTGDESKETNYAQHHPKFKVDDDVLYKGVAAIAQYAVNFINKTAAR